MIFVTNLNKIFKCKFFVTIYHKLVNSFTPAGLYVSGRSVMISSIQPYSNNNVSMQGKWSWKNIKSRAKQSFLDAIPEHTFSSTPQKTKKISRIDDRLTRPAENRGIMGLFALILQPLIDACNKRVDDETRKVSVCRTIAKIIAGTLVGMCVRGACYKMVSNMTNLGKNSKFSKALIPEGISFDSEALRKHRNNVSTFIALLAMCVTNFVLDAPLTVMFANLLTEKAGVKKQKEAADVQVS